MNDFTESAIASIIIVNIILGILHYGFACDITTETETFDVFSTDAPEGYYWVQGIGTPILFSYRYNEKLTESYTIKYTADTQYGTELKTLILDSTSNILHVILLDTNDTMYLEINNEVTQYRFVDKEKKHVDSYNLYIPNSQNYDEADKNE